MDLKIKDYFESPGSTERYANSLAQKEAGVDMRIETAAGIAFIDQVRAVRGIIIRSFLDPEEIAKLYLRQQDIVQKKLSPEEIDKLIHLVITASSLVGSVYLERDEKIRIDRVSQLQQVLDKIREKTKEIKWGHTYSNYANDTALFTLSSWMARYRTKRDIQTDDLGKIVGSPNPHPYLKGLTITEIKNKLSSTYDLLVIAPAASSGVLQAAVLAEYLRREHGFKVTIDPVFFSKELGRVGARLKYMTDEYPNLGREIRPLVLPFDDNVVLTGNSPRQAALAAIKKYGIEDVIMNPVLKKLVRT